MPNDSFTIQYYPGVYRCKIKIMSVPGQGLTVHTEKPMPFADTIKMDFVSHDGLLYEHKVEESETIAKMISSIQNSDFYAIMNSSEEYQTRGAGNVVLTKGDFGFRFELTLHNPELSENPETKRIYNILLELIDSIGMADWFNYDTRRKAK